jgi:integrase
VTGVVPWWYPGGNGKLPNAALVVRTDAQGRPVYEAKWRRNGCQVKRRVGLAWLDAGEDGTWRRRRGRAGDGFLDEKRATVRAAELVAEHDEAVRETERVRRERRELGATVRELAAEWLEYVEREKGAKPATIQDYGYLLAEPGRAHRRGAGSSRGQIMLALGGRRITKVKTADVATFLRELEREGMSARSVNKERAVLSAMFSYAQREDTYALEHNPVSGTNKRREAPPVVLDFFEPEEIEALARAASAGAHRGTHRAELDADEVAWRAWEDRQDSELYRVAAYTGMRLGELLALCWEDVDLERRRVIVHRAVSAGVEGPTKSRQARALPLADRAAQALARLAQRGDYAGRDDYVFCSRLGRRLDRSAVRRRYTRARDAAGLRSLRFHSLRHAAGSMVAREAGAHFVQAFLGHSRLSTTERYLHAKSRPQDVATLNRAFAGTLAPETAAGREQARDPVDARQVVRNLSPGRLHPLDEQLQIMRARQLHFAKDKRCLQGLLDSLLCVKADCTVVNVRLLGEHATDTNVARSPAKKHLRIFDVLRTRRQPVPRAVHDQPSCP